MASKQLSTKLWQAAYNAIVNDPDEYEVFEKFVKVVSQRQGSTPDISSESGRKRLTKTVDKLAANLQSSSSPKTMEVFSKLRKFRDLISTGASVNPCATVAVAGLFVAFDLFLMHQAEEAFISDIISTVADISCRNELLHHFVEGQPNEHAQLLDARSELKAAFVQVKRTSLLLTMKVVYKLNSWHKIFLAAGSWGVKLKNLQDLETRADKYIRDINIHIHSPPPRASNWKDKRLPQLHRLVRDGRADDVYKLLSDGKFPPNLLNEKTPKGWTPLMFAVRHGQYKILTYLLRAEKIQVNAKNIDGNTALILAAQHNRPGHTKQLVEARAKIDVRNKYERTAWQEAAMKCNIKPMKILLEKGDDINQVTGKNGWCALHTAIEKDNTGMTKWLLEMGAKTNIKIKAGGSKGLTPRELAQKFNRGKALEMLPV